MTIEQYELKLKDTLDINGVTITDTFYGIRASYRMDTWYIQTKGIDGESARIALFHKNMFTSKKSSGAVPDAHLQLRGSFTCEDLLNYILKHGRKFTSADPKVKHLRRAA